MSVLEIILLITGGVVFVLSFLIPVRKEQVPEETRTLAKKEIEELVAREMDSIRDHVDDVVDEAVSYSMEKTERSMERLSNEKIMAVSEYSDTVLQEIHKNHEEVMFLYDMLNSKHVNLKNTVSEANETVKKVAETRKEAEAVVSSFQKLTPETVETAKSEPAVAADAGRNTPGDAGKEGGVSGNIDPTDEEERDRNCNARILELRRQGKSKVAIAKELGLGVGEVKLVIDLYQNT